MLTPLTKKKGLDESLWGVSSKSMRSTFSNRRKALAGKLGNPRLMKIKLKTFRHWKATMEYHRTKDILYVKELLGHKNIQNTLVYTHLVSFEEDDAWVVKVASSIEEYVALLESGFEYVSDYNEVKVLRKRK
jgi:integrase